MWVEDSGMMGERMIFKDIIEKLEEEFEPNKECFECEDDYNYAEKRYQKMLFIVNQAAQKYKSKAVWIPCDVRYPDTDTYILLSFENFSIPCVGRYEEDEEGGAFFVGDDTGTCTSYGLVVNAWMPLPVAYNSENEGCMSNGDVIRSMSDEELTNALLKIEDIGKHLPFCGHSHKCDEILDAGELIPDGMCRECLLKWLQEVCK